MKKFFLPLLMVVGCIALLTGCSSGVERIGVEVHLVKLQRKSDGSFLASLEFSNPNVGPLNLAKSSHLVSLNGQSAGTLEVVEALGIPALQAATVTATLNRGAGAPELSGTITYQLASTLTITLYDDNTERYKTSSSGSVAVQ